MKRKAQKSELKHWQAEDAGRLRDLIRRAKQSPSWPGIDEFASACIGRSGSFLSQLTSGYRPMNLQHAIGLAKGLGVEVNEISPTLAAALPGAQRAMPVESPGKSSPQNRRFNEYDRAMFSAFGTLEREVKMSIRNMIFALATAKNPHHAQWSNEIEQFNEQRDSVRSVPRRATKRAES